MIEPARTEAIATSTVDPAEVERYNTLAATWWQADGPMWPLHKLNALRAPWVIEQARQHFRRSALSAQPLQGLRVLDIGCGGGLLSEALARAGASVTGIDVAERNVMIARQHANATGLDINYVHTPIESLQARPFDIVLNMEVVEHVNDLPLFMRHATDYVAPGGVMFLATLNRTLRSFVAAIIGAEHVLRWLPRGTHEWRRFVKPEEAIRMLQQGNLTVTQKTGVKVNPLNRHYSLGPDLGVNYMLAAVRS